MTALFTPDRSHLLSSDDALRLEDAVAAFLDAWSELVGISHGAACTSQSYTCSHVLSAMGLPSWRIDGALRFSWCATTPEPDWSALVAAIERYREVQKAALT